MNLKIRIIVTMMIALSTADFGVTKELYVAGTKQCAGKETWFLSDSGRSTAPTDYNYRLSVNFGITGTAGLPDTWMLLPFETDIFSQRLRPEVAFNYLGEIIATIGDCIVYINETRDFPQTNCSAYLLAWNLQFFDPEFGLELEADTNHTICMTISNEAREFPEPIALETVGTVKRATRSVVILYEKNILTFIPDDNYPYAITILGDVVIERESVGVHTESLPNNWTTSHFSVYAYVGPLPVAREIFNYQAQSSCHQANCFWCMENFETFDCLTYANKTALVAGIIIGSILVVLTLIMTVVLVSSTCRITTAQALLIVLIVLPGALACDTNLILTGSAVDCVVTGTEEVCKITTQSLVTMPNLGGTICLTILNAQGDLLMGYINITYVESLAVVGTRMDYWTSNRQITGASSKHCAGSIYCSAKVNCAKVVTPRARPNMGGALVGPPTIMPGLSFCTDGCGCAGCNCFNCAEACVYGRWAVEPVPSLWRVLSLTTSRLVPRIEVCYGDSSGTTNCTTGMFTAGSTKQFGGNYTISYIGSFQTSFNFLGRKILVSENRAAAFFVDASMRNVPVAGTVGEIQGNSASSFTNFTPDSFIVAQNLCEYYVSDSLMHFTCAAAPLNGATSSGIPLPSIVDGVFWSYSSDDSLIGAVLNPPGIALSLIGTGQLEFRTRRTQVCPDLVFNGLEGEWGNELGAIIRINGRSTCLPGKCLLSTRSTRVGLLSVYLDLSIQEEEHTVFFTSNAAEVDFELICSSISLTTSVMIRGTLDDPTPITPVRPNEPPSGFNYWFDGLSLGGKIGFSIGMAVVSIILIAVLIAMIIFRREIAEFMIWLWAMIKIKMNKTPEHEPISEDNPKEESDTELSSEEDTRDMDELEKEEKENKATLSRRIIVNRMRRRGMP